VALRHGLSDGGVIPPSEGGNGGLSSGIFANHVPGPAIHQLGKAGLDRIELREGGREGGSVVWGEGGSWKEARKQRALAGRDEQTTK